MTLLETWVQTPAAKALGWTLVHSLWEGAILAVALASALSAIGSARVRHPVACVALAAMLGSFDSLSGAWRCNSKSRSRLPDFAKSQWAPVASRTRR